MSGNWSCLQQGVASCSASSLSQPRSWASGEQLDHDAAGLPLGQSLEQSIEGSPVCLARKELVAIDQVQQRHRLAAQGMDDVPVVDDLVVLARWMGRARAAAS